MEIPDLRTMRLNPAAVAEAAAKRTRRPDFLPADQRLMIIAADHPARAALAAGGNPMAMADRDELLRRLATALSRPGVDGVLGTPDILEDLLLMGVLDDKLVFGSMNRGGLMGASFEFDDRFTAYDASAVAAANFDGAKLLLRIAPDEDVTADLLQACADAISDCADHQLPILVEPFWSYRDSDGKVQHDFSAEAMTKAVTVASGLGTSSAYTWMKLPVIDALPEVMASTTMPTLLLGGDPSVAPEKTYAAWRAALEIPGVRGLVVGRALLYPPDGDVAKAVDTAVSMVHAQF